MDGKSKNAGQQAKNQPGHSGNAAKRPIVARVAAETVKTATAKAKADKAILPAAPATKKAEAKAQAGASQIKPKPSHPTATTSAAVKTLKTAVKPKASDKPEEVQAAKPAAKPAKAAAEAVPSAKVQALQGEAPDQASPGTKQAAKPAPAKQAAKAPATASVKQAAPVLEPAAAPAEPNELPAATPAPSPPSPAPTSHSGVISGPMRPLTPPRAMAKAEIFVDGDFVVYPTHGVGKVERIATEEIAGHKLELIHITFDENRMTLRVPTNKARTAGLRKLASRKQFDEVLATLKGRARIKRTMWSRRAQEYEAKINSGDPSAIAEVVRDLHRNAGQPDQSFSERQIYESALDLAAEYAALEAVDKPTAIERLIAHLKSD
jgi:CarD family transcriptional regulator